MKIISKTIKLLPVFLLVLGLNSCSDDDNNDGPSAMTTTIVDLAVNAPQLSSLVQALTIADAAGANFVTTLSGTGPFTVFAPDNDAFQALLDSEPTWNSLNDIPEAVLIQVLANHVIVGENIAASDLVSAGSGYRSTLASGPNDSNLSIYFNVVNGVVQLNGGATSAVGANVSTPDVEATNGTVHIVNSVLLPPSVVDFALANPALSNLVAALLYADSQNPSPDLVGTLSGPSPFTVFAPTDAAFGDLLTELGVSALTDIDEATVQAVLLIHVVNGANVRSNQLSTGTVTTLGGEVLINATNLTITDPQDRVTNIAVPLVDIQGVNGVVHVVDRVIRP